MNQAARAAIYKQIEQERDTKVIAFVTGERLGLETQIAEDAVTPFVMLLDKIGPTKRLSLIIDTNGGHTSSAWRIIQLIRSFCDELEVIVPSKARSAGTLISLGANKIIMTKQAALGPIDPSLTNHPLAPDVKNVRGDMVKLSVSAEAVRGYLAEAKKDIKDDTAMASVWNHLSSQIHPIVLGELFRLGEQIRGMATTLLQRQVADKDTREKIVQLLCSDSGSHDYTINRRQAADVGLNVEKPSAAFYGLLMQIAQSFLVELQTLQPLSHAAILGADKQKDYTHVRGLIESSGNGECYAYVTQGSLTLKGANITDQKAFEGWRKLP